MADVSISQLTQGTPAGNSILPYSTGSNTLGVPVSAILQNAGNVGIGIDNPVRRLEVNGAIKSYSAGGNLIFNSDSGYEWWTGSWNDFVSYQVTRRKISDGVGTSHLTINTLGNVGIGTITPSTKLDVNGTIKATGLQVPGCVLQVVQAYKTDIWNASTTGIGWEDVPGLSVSITLKSATSKVLINASVAASKRGDGNDAVVRIMRVTGSTSVAVGGGANPGSTFNNAFGQVAGQYSGQFQSFSLNTMYLDTPAGVTSTYKIQFYNNGPQAARVNCRALFDDFTVASHITLQEIAG